MKIIQISRSYDRKVSDGNYGSIGQFASMTADLGENEIPEEASEILYELCKKEVERSMGTAFPEEEEVQNLPTERPPVSNNTAVQLVDGEYVPAPKKRWTGDPAFKMPQGMKSQVETPKDYRKPEIIKRAR